MIYNEARVEMLRRRYPEGTRICIDSMENDPLAIPQGTLGTVQFIDGIGTIHCKFDNGRYLRVIFGEDSFHKINQEQDPENEQAEEIEEPNTSM